MGERETLLKLVVALARASTATPREWSEPKPGDLVVECTGWRRPPDPDAIGWLIGHGPAPYGEDDPLDGSVPMREVWDVLPLNPDAKLNAWDCQRWENSRFEVVEPRHLHGIDLSVFQGGPRHLAV